MAEVSISVIIPVRDRWGPLAWCLLSLARQVAAPPFEVIVVDDGSREPMPSGLAELTWPFKLRIFRQAPGGIGAARNRAIPAASGDLLVFVDSDVRVDPHLLQFLRRAADEHPQDVAFQANLLGGRDSIVHRMEGLRLAATLDSLQQPDGRIRYANTATFAVRARYACSRQPFFDPAMVRGEDTRMLADLAARGQFPRYVPAATACHLPPLRTGRYLLKHLRIGFLDGPSRRVISAVPAVLMSTRTRLSVLRGLFRHCRDPRDLAAAGLILLAYSLELCGRALGWCASSLSASRAKVANDA